MSTVREEYDIMEDFSIIWNLSLAIGEEEAKGLNNPSKVVQKFRALDEKEREKIIEASEYLKNTDKTKKDVMYGGTNGTMKKLDSMMHQGDSEGRFMTICLNCVSGDEDGAIDPEMSGFYTLIKCRKCRKMEKIARDFLNTCKKNK